MKETTIVKDLTEIQNRVEDLQNYSVLCINREMEAERPNMGVSPLLIEVQSASTILVLALKNLSAYYKNYLDDGDTRIEPKSRKPKTLRAE
jgi:hypothetical protein